MNFLQVKVVAFVGETFEMFDGFCHTKPTSAAFLQDTFGTDNVYVCSPVVEALEQPISFSTKVAANRFLPFPHYSSTKDFVIKSLFKPGFLSQYTKVADEVIAAHKDGYFWIRTPSIGSIVFGLRALKANQKVLHHMCADASNTWRDAKYSGVEKLLGFMLSRLIRHKLKQICSHPNTVNLCTGSALEAFSRSYAPNQTLQFVDVMVQPPKDIVDKDLIPGFIKILFVGRIVEDKGVFDLLHVAARLQGKCYVTIVGDGPDLAKAKALVSKLSISDSVEFTGQLPHEKLSGIYNSVDLVVVPSNNHYEGFPRVIMEAWSHHKPVVVADVGGIRAFVKNGENGLIYSPGDTNQFYQSVATLIEDEVLYEHLRKGAQIMAPISLQRYWLDVLRAKLEKHYDA